MVFVRTGAVGVKQHQPGVEIAAGNRWYTADQFHAQLGSRGRRRVIENRWRIFQEMIAEWRQAEGLECARYLDAGCGDGINLLGMQQIAQRLATRMCVSAIDYNPLRLARARQAAPSAHIQQASLYDLPFADSVFDIVLCNHVIEHVPEVGRVSSELFRVLRPGGLLIVGVPNEGCAMARLRNHWIQPSIARETDHVNFFTAASLTETMRRHGFEVQRLERETFFFPHSYINAGLNEIAAGHWLMAVLRQWCPSQAGGLIVSALKPPAPRG